MNQELAKQYPWGAENCWQKRSNKIAQIIPSNSSVLDLGGGFGHIKKYLVNCDYKSIDLQKWTEETIIANLNKGQFPDLGKFDYIVAQGILEYIEKPEIFLNKIKKYAPILLLTYRLGGSNGKIKRNNLNFVQIRKLLNDTKWIVPFDKYVFEKKGLKNEKIYYCVNRKYGKKC